jgi:hypothetical protein
MATVTIIPRLIRLSNAAEYLGMSPPEFEKRVRPYVTAIRPEGTRAVFFDREDLDAWADEFKERHAIKHPEQPESRETPWQNPHRGLESAATSGTLKKSLQDNHFVKALKKRASKMRNVT